jgi:hypothetical protein
MLTGCLSRFDGPGRRQSFTSEPGRKKALAKRTPQCLIYIDAIQREA